MQFPRDQFIDTTCRDCKRGRYGPTDTENEWWVKCKECTALLFCYVPMDHQFDFHMDNHKFRMWAGGFGSAKTSTCGAEMIRHFLETPNGQSLVGAQTYTQLEETAKKQILDMVPEELREEYLIQKQKLILKNGHTVLFRSFDDEGKLRSLNLTAWWIEESSEVSYDVFSQLQTRLRNHATKKHMGILSTNPDLGWIRGEFLLKSSNITGATELYHQAPDDINPDLSTHIAATSLNTYLPDDFYDSVARNKPEWYIKRYLEGSFSFTEGAVYPTFSKHIVDMEPEDIRDSVRKYGWRVYSGADWGLRDPTVMLLAAVDPKTGTVYVYDEHYEANKPIKHHAKIMNGKLEHIPFGSLMRMVGDPSGARRNMNDKRSIFDHYAEYGLFWQPGNNRIEPGIQKVFSYFDMGKLKILKSCVNTITEGVSYKYKPQELDAKKNLDEKPEDKDNHAMDTLRYIVQELPDDPDQLINPSYGEPVGNGVDESHLPYALRSDDDPYASESDAFMYY
jgi:PBSX family phage terminase large subunit